MITAGYCAGLFDGEGSLSIRYKRKGATYSVTARINMVDQRPTQEFEKEFGGCLNLRRGHGNSRDTTQWTLTGESVREFLQVIKPFLIVKKEHAEVAERFIEAYYHPRVNHKHRPLEVQMIAAECRTQMMKLNRRGKPPVEEPWETL